MLKSKFFDQCRKNSESLLATGLTALGTYLSPSKAPLDVEDEVKFGEKGRGVTYTYTATGCPVSLPMDYEKKLELEDKWEREHAQMSKCKTCRK